MSRPFGLGVQLPEVERDVGWGEYAAMATEAEHAGLDSLWIGDHLLYRGDGREERGPWDVWALLAGLAAVTDRIRLGPLVACTAFSPPGVLARRAAAVQEISGGRLVLGLGAGWNETEFAAFGLPFDHRATRFEEAFEIVRRLLAGERVTFDGAFENLDDAVLLPRRSPPPIMVGSTGERVLRATLPYVDGWNIWHDWYGNTPEGLAAQNERVTRLARQVGRDPSDIFRSATVFVSVGAGAGSRPHVANAPPVTGSVREIASRLRAFRDTGIDELILVIEPIDRASIELAGNVRDAMSA